MYKASIIFSIFLIASVLISGATANSCGLPYYTVDGVLLLSPPYPLQNVSDIAPELTSELSAVMNVANWRLDVYVAAVNTTDNSTDLYALFTIVPPSPDTCQTEPDSITAIYTLNTAILYGELPYGYIQWINPSWQLIVPEHAQCYLLDSGLSCDDALFSNSSQPTSTPFPFNTTTPFPFNTSTPFPFNTSTPFPFNTSTPFPFNTTTPFPFNTSTPFPFNTTTPFPFNTSTPFPFNTTTPRPFNTSTPFPFNTTTPRPFNTSTPFPFNTTTPRPFNTSTPFPFNTTTPRPFNTSTPFPFNTTTPRPFNTSTPFPFNTTTPRPFNTSTPFPFNTTTPRPFNTSTPFPFNTTTPRPFNTSTPFPFNTTTPRPFNTSTPFPFNTTTPRPFNTSTPFPFNTTTARPFNTSTPFPFNTTTPFPFNTSTPFPFNTSTPFPFNTSTPFPFNTSTAFPFNTTTSTSYPCGPLYTISGALRFVPPINVSVPLEQVFLEMSLAMNVSYSRVTGWAQRPQDAWYVYFTVDAPTNCATEIDSIRAIYALNRTLDAGGRGYRILSWADPNWQLLQPGHADCYYQVSRESCDSVLYQISPSTGRDNSAGSYNILNSINDNTGLSIFLIIVLPIAGFLVGILATCIYARRKQRSLTEKTIQLQQLLLGVEIGSTTVQPGKFEPMHA